MNTFHELSDMLEKANKALLSAAQTIEVLGMENQKMRETSAKFYANESSPPQRTWVGLSTDEFKFIASKYLLSREAGLEYFQEEIEAKLKEKNT